MTRLQAVADLPEFQCLLCGSEAETYVDLCDRCADAFRATAERVAAAYLAARLPAGVQVVHVAGQLELDQAVEVPADRWSAKSHQRVTLKSVQVGDRLMTQDAADGRVEACRWSDGTVRTVADLNVVWPGRQVVLVFEDGTVTEARFGTTAHYPADVFEAGR